MMQRQLQSVGNAPEFRANEKPRLALVKVYSDQPARWFCLGGHAKGDGPTPFYAYCEWLGTKRLADAQLARRRELIEDIRRQRTQ